MEKVNEKELLERLVAKHKEISAREGNSALADRAYGPKIQILKARLETKVETKQGDSMNWRKIILGALVTAVVLQALIWASKHEAEITTMIKCFEQGCEPEKAVTK